MSAPDKEPATPAARQRAGRVRRARRKQPVLHPGSRGPAVAALQQQLSRLGFYGGEIDAIYGDLTFEAVRSFQRAFRLPPDGLAGPEVLGLLDDPFLQAGEAAPGHRLVVAWADGDLPTEDQRPQWVSMWAVPGLELVADPLGRMWLSDGEAGRVARNGPLRGPLPVLTVRPARSVSLTRRSGLQQIARMLTGSGRVARVIVAVPDGDGAPARSGSAEMPPPGAFRLARALGRSGVSCWLSLRLSSPARLLSLRWWGYEVTRRAGVFERMVVWAPPVVGDSFEPEIAAVRAAIQGVRRWRPPWRVLLGLDLSPWLIEPPETPGRPPGRRRLTRTEAVLAAWQLRLRRLKGEDPATLPTVVRCTPARVRAFVSFVKWAGLGGIVLRGLDRADPPVLAVVENTMPALKFSDDPS